MLVEAAFVTDLSYALWLHSRAEPIKLPFCFPVTIRLFKYKANITNFLLLFSNYDSLRCNTYINREITPFKTGVQIIALDHIFNQKITHNIQVVLKKKWHKSRVVLYAEKYSKRSV
jgi:hypothetical protein